MTMMALDTLTVCLQATVRAGREVGFSQAAVKSRKRAEELLAALEALKPADDEDEDADRAGQGGEPEAGRVESAEPVKLSTPKAVLAELERVTGPISTKEMRRRLGGYGAEAIGQAIYAAEQQGLVRTWRVAGQKAKMIVLVRAGMEEIGPAVEPLPTGQAIVAALRQAGGSLNRKELCAQLADYNDHAVGSAITRLMEKGVVRTDLIPGKQKEKVVTLLVDLAGGTVETPATAGTGAKRV